MCRYRICFASVCVLLVCGVVVGALPKSRTKRQTSTGVTCHAPYRAVGSGCYALVPSPTLSQAQAAHLCSNLNGGRLLTLTTRQQYLDVRNWLRRYKSGTNPSSHVSFYGVWTAGRMLGRPSCRRYWMTTGHAIGVTIDVVNANIYRCGDWALKLSASHQYAAADWNRHARLSTVCQAQIY